MTTWPDSPADRDRFVLERRSGRPEHDPWRPQGVILEDERAEDGRIVRTTTVFLTGRECPWRCAMCDLWKHTIAGDTPPGAIPAQIASAREVMERERHDAQVMKLYNAGSFFDPRAVPLEDYELVGGLLAGLERVIVESHPALVGPRVDRLLAALESGREPPPRLEVAMGLETAHPGALAALNKRMTLNGFSRAADALAARGVALRVFLLVGTPFVPSREHDSWLLRSIDAAAACGATAVSLVPTRPGNGTLEAMPDAFRAPRLHDIERCAVLAHEARRPGVRVFVDLWDLEPFSACASCFRARCDRLHAINLSQRLRPPIECGACGAGSPA